MLADNNRHPLYGHVSTAVGYSIHMSRHSQLQQRILDGRSRTQAFVSMTYVVYFGIWGSPSRHEEATTYSDGKITERINLQRDGNHAKPYQVRQGGRLRGFDVNTLIRSRSRQRKATKRSPRTSSRTIEAYTGIRFGIVQAHQFAAIPVAEQTDRQRPLALRRQRTPW